MENEDLKKKEEIEKEERMRAGARIKAENELNQENKKAKAPIWKKWWFWVIAVIVFFMIVGAFSDKPAEESKVTDSVEEVGRIKEEVEEGYNPTVGEKNALSSAKNYLNFSSFSYKGLVRQLEFEGYSNEEAIYAVNNCGADWNEQAAKSAKNYLNFSSFSRDGLIAQLEFEGFTNQQAEYGAQAVGY